MMLFTMFKDRSKEQKREIVFATIAFVIFVFMMVYNLMHSALWFDEWIEYFYSQASIKDGSMYAKIVSTFQPPLYNFVMHFWLKVSSSFVWFRLFNVLIGSIAAVYLYLTIKRLYNYKTACITLIVLAFCYEWIYCVQECSEYGLMLLGLFQALYFYVELEHRFTYPKMFAFILGCIVGIYSQYGAVFVILPLLLCFFFRNMLNKEVEMKRKKVIISSYLFCLMGFALPLYWFFMRIQMANNEISGHTQSFEISFLKEFPIMLGQMIGYFYHQSYDGWMDLWKIVSVLLLICILCILKRKNVSWTKKSLLLSLLTAYILHFVLVKLQIYAMMHANQSLGFFSRYSYFYMPLLAVTLSIVWQEIYTVCSKKYQKIVYGAIAGVLTISVLFSIPSLLENWGKANDDIYAEMWIDNKGWEDTTYVFGSSASWGFNYYIHEDERYDDVMYQYVIFGEPIADALDEKFWMWKSGRDNSNAFNKVLSHASAYGYTIEVYDEYGLACCYLDNYEDYVVLDEETLDIHVVQVDVDENNILRVEVQIADLAGKIHNLRGYQLSYNLYDSNGTVFGWDCDRKWLGPIIEDPTYTFEIDLNSITEKNFDIQIDVTQANGMWNSYFEETLELLPVIEIRDGMLYGEN